MLSKHIKTAINEVRMQMVGAHFLFGLQLQGSFHSGFERLTPTARLVDAAALSGIVLTLTTLIAGPAQHRLVERGDASYRVLGVLRRCASAALGLLSLTLGCDAFVVTEHYLGTAWGAALAAITVLSSLGLWYGLGAWLGRRGRSEPRPGRGAQGAQYAEPTPIAEKVDLLLTEVRVVLPGIEGLIGFRLVIPLTAAFAQIPAEARAMHFTALALIALSSMLLLTPAPVHRIAFHGADSARFHRIGSRLVTLALAPFALGVACDFYVAAGRMLGFGRGAAAGAALLFAIMTTSWYLVPWAIRRRHGIERAGVLSHHPT